MQDRSVSFMISFSRKARFSIPILHNLFYLRRGFYRIYRILILEHLLWSWNNSFTEGRHILAGSSESHLCILFSLCVSCSYETWQFGGTPAGSSESILYVLFSLRIFLFMWNVTIRRYRYVATQMMYIRFITSSVSFCFSADLRASA